MSGSHTSVIFDFDGTLVNSARGILSGISQTLNIHAITPRVPLTSAIVGPPLVQTLSLVSGLNDKDSLARLASEFKQCYDQGGYRDTDPYPGIANALHALRDAGFPLLIVTNKRGVPTRLVLKHLGWDTLFDAVYCHDEYPDCADKSEVLARLLKERSLSADASPYIGDTASDARAAAANGMPFLHAGWGYGDDAQELRDALTCATPSKMLEILMQNFPAKKPCPAN